MKPRMLAGLLLLVALGAARAEAPGELIVPAATAKTAGWEVHGGALRMVPKQPGLALATTRKPGGKREAAFVVLFAHAYELTSKAATSEEVSEDDSGRLGIRQSLDIDGAKVTFSYNLRFDPKDNRVLAETASVAGKALDLKKGRVVVLDLTAKPVRWEQVDDKLPTDVGDVGEEEVVRKVARDLTERLMKVDRVKKFLAKP